MRQPTHADVLSQVAPVLDPRQLIRIEAVHRGFFYQHLYAVAILLNIPGTSQSLAIERDEDLEVRGEGTTAYLQVKSRLGQLQPHDIADALVHFEDLRNAHGSGQRQDAATFAIVSNAEPSHSLLNRITSADWPTDVEVITPGRPSGRGLPAAAPTTAAALEACEVAAAAIPFGNLPPATLVLKLASVVQYHASGAGGHLITAEALSPLLEQIVAQLHDFPEPPRPYHPQRNEPSIASDQRVRLIVGFSGAGKTAWAAEAVRHQSEPVAYLMRADCRVRQSPAIWRASSWRGLSGRGPRGRSCRLGSDLTCCVPPTRFLPNKGHAPSSFWTTLTISTRRPSSGRGSDAQYVIPRSGPALDRSCADRSAASHPSGRARGIRR